jgi:hypothetical protein
MLCRILLLLGCLPSLAGAGPEQVGTTSAAFLKLGSGARPEALGEAYTALADDASGVDFNPAGMSQMLGGEIQATHTEWFQGLRYENINGVFSLGNGGMIGMTFDFLSMPGITRTEQIANTPDPSLNFRETGTFNPFDMQFALAYSRPVYSSLALGVNFKVLSQNIDDRSSLGLAADIGGILQTPVTGLTLGLAFQNLGTPIKLNHEAFELPWGTRLGGAYRILDKKLLLLLESDLPSDNAETFSFGMEYSVADKFYPRMGYRLNGVFNPWSVGLGLRFGSTTFDLSVVPYGELGLTYRASLGYHFGEPAATLTAPLPYLSSGPKAKPVALLPKVTAPDKVVAWGLFIYDSSRPAKVVRQFSGQGAPENEISWNGQLASGQAAAEGTYQAVFSARYTTGKVVHTAYVRLDLSNTVPQVDVSLDPASVNPAAAGEAFVPTLFRPLLKAGRMALRWRLEILDGRDQVFRTYHGEGAPPTTLVWDGKSDKAEALVSGQIYQARMWAVDPLGNEASSLSPVSFRAVFR